MLTPDSGGYWFKAAAVVTGPFGVGAIEQGELRLLNFFGLRQISRDAESFMLSGNRALFDFNVQNYSDLKKGSDIPGLDGLSGADLDNALVVFEQTLVQRHIEGFLEGKSQEYRETLGREMSRLFDHRAGSEKIRATIKEQFGDSFDFFDLDHRVQLGQRLVEKERQNESN